jgi:hypothetical protein
MRMTMLTEQPISCQEDHKATSLFLSLSSLEVYNVEIWGSVYKALGRLEHQAQSMGAGLLCPVLRHWRKEPDHVQG